MTTLSSTSRFPFYFFGLLAEVEYLPQNNAVSYRLPQWSDDSQIDAADFIQQFGSCLIDCDFPEIGTIGERIFRIHIISQDLHDLYTMGDDHFRPAFRILAEWRENNFYCVRVQDDFGGSFTFRFAENGKITRSSHEDFVTVADITPIL